MAVLPPRRQRRAAYIDCSFMYILCEMLFFCYLTCQFPGFSRLVLLLLASAEER